MRWKTNAPVVGEKRVKRRFALFPKALSDGNTVWLGFYTLTQTFTERLQVEVTGLRFMEYQWEDTNTSL